ncbi:MAG: hypothetical protein WA004_20605 [Saprospiraceae bacterium]
MKPIFYLLAAMAIGFGLTTCSPPPPDGPDDICHTVLGYHLGGTASAEVKLEEGGNPNLLFRVWGEGFATVIPTGCEIIDASGNGYPDALQEETEIGPESAWGESEGVLSTPAGQGGQFEGAGTRFLGFRIPSSNNTHKYGWVKLECKQGGTQLFITDFAINQEADQPIITGQTGTEQNCPPYPEGLVETVQDIIGTYRDNPDPAADQCNIKILESEDPGFDFTVQYFPFIFPSKKVHGKIINGRPIITWADWSGNVPSPGGSDRPYEASLCGYGTMQQEGQQLSIAWHIDYHQVGFSAASHHGAFTLYKCD